MPTASGLSGMIAWLLLFLSQLGAWAMTSQARAQTVFAHLGDPQIGYGHAGRAADAEQFERVLAAVGDKGVAFVAIPGDLVQDRTFLQWRSFMGALATTSLPVHLTPGNHEVVDTGSLADFRDELGRDYYDVSHGDVTLVVVNSETARSPELDAQEFSEQWAWLERTLAKHAGQPGARFIVTHRPPFMQAANEPDSGGNWPADTRARLLGLLKQHGVKHVLAGHLHRTVRAHDPETDVTVYVVGGSARVTDDRGAGYRAFEVQGENVKQRYVSLFATPSPPPDFMGVRGWTPRLFDFSVRHWLLTLLYAVAGALSLRAARGFRVRGASVFADTSFVLWAIIGAALWFFGINEQLDFDELIVGLARAAVRARGLFDLRHGLGTAVAALVVVTGSALLAFVWWRAKRGRGPANLALSAIVSPAAWFVLSTLSDHDFGMIFSLFTWDVALFASVLLSLVAGRRGLRQSRASAELPAGSAD